MNKMATTSAPSGLSCSATSISSAPTVPPDSPIATSYWAARARARCHAPRVAFLQVIRPGADSEVFAPAAAQVMGCRFGLAVTGEDTLLVSADPHDARRGGEVCEVPDLFTDHGIDSIEHPMVHLQVFDLVFLAPWVAGGDGCKPGYVSAPYSVMMIGLPSPAQAVSSASQSNSAASGHRC